MRRNGYFWTSGVNVDTIVWLPDLDFLLDCKISAIATQLEDPMPIRSWFMRYNVSHWLPLIIIENAYAATAHAPNHVTRQ